MSPFLSSWVSLVAKTAVISTWLIIPLAFIANASMVRAHRHDVIRGVTAGGVIIGMIPISIASLLLWHRSSVLRRMVYDPIASRAHSHHVAQERWRTAPYLRWGVAGAWCAQLLALVICGSVAREDRIREMECAIIIATVGLPATLLAWYFLLPIAPENDAEQEQEKGGITDY